MMRAAGRLLGGAVLAVALLALAGCGASAPAPAPTDDASSFLFTEAEPHNTADMTLSWKPMGSKSILLTLGGSGSAACAPKPVSGDFSAGTVTVTLAPPSADMCTADFRLYGFEVESSLANFPEEVRDLRVCTGDGLCDTLVKA